MQKKNFIPSIHGFSFVNQFSTNIIPDSFASLKNSISHNCQINYGLCGGMCFATSDFFLAGRKIPSMTNSPQPGSSLYRYLHKRQIDSYGYGWQLVAKFATWTLLADKTVQKLTDKELQKIIWYLNNKEVVILGIVYVGKTLAIWLNHQVLAYDYTNAETLKIKIYDPNYPSRDDIYIEIAKKPTGIQYRQKSVNGDINRHIRGFFIIPYVPKEPPFFETSI